MALKFKSVFNGILTKIKMKLYKRHPFVGVSKSRVLVGDNMGDGVVSSVKNVYNEGLFHTRGHYVKLSKKGDSDD